ncbi:nuclear transport factor 2 family protein [Kineosporia rhizophila]|uniref:nuclear transport factor 2 family protein n=1 Tax=Kineosporia TaxID=49184 RepID=UPI001E2AB7ED|nr:MULTISPECIES: nuclear transport factor 2 family protein [Kineosporia]MCE0534517.1 nuclear transport factor 2 family protein [Kineosporia rhizophila]GLY14055.1 hypothetical protein Kisp01_10710 [Kineosporia sp. NBRC 101677]
MADAAMLGSWIAAYLRAWQSNAPDDIGGIFASDARYFTAPYAQPWVGREAIVAGWIARGDVPGSFAMDWDIVSCTEDVQVVRATTRYPATTFSNLWVIRLDRDGRCREFTEYWMEHPRP